jgi:hypothetical protein
MADIRAAFGTSHAFALMPPTGWDDFRAKNRAGYARRFGQLPDEQPQVFAESTAANSERHKRISGALEEIRLALAADPPDAIVIIADDQNENLTRANLPQVAVYTGGDFFTNRDRTGKRRSLPALAHAIHAHAVESDIDMAELNAFSDDVLFAHAYGPVLSAIDPGATIPVVPVFINEIHVPAPSPARCYYIGSVLGETIRAFAGAASVAIVASGGLSHFTAGYPWEHYRGVHRYGSIDEKFDHWVLEQLRAGNGARLAELSSNDLLDSGAVELRAWIAMLGAIGPAKPTALVYEPFYQGIMGMGVGRWNLHASSPEGIAS